MTPPYMKPPYIISRTLCYNSTIFLLVIQYLCMSVELF